VLGKERLVEGRIMIVVDGGTDEISGPIGAKNLK
jgi:hypothetical protein